MGRSEKWLNAIAVPIFFGIIALIFWAIASADNHNRMKPIFSKSISIAAETVVDCLKNDPTGKLNLRQPKRRKYFKKTDPNVYFVQNAVWHIHVYVTDMRTHTKIDILARDKKISSEQMSAIQVCIGSDW